LGQTITQIDAFTNEPYGGNPAAVCILPEPRSEEWMQRVAGEMNLSETAFLQKSADGYDLRWFTPAVEVALCGHATLASAHVLWEAGYLQPNEQARFHTLSGLLTATRKADWIELDFPANLAQKVDAPAGLLEALGTGTPEYVGKNKFDYLVEVESEKAVAEMQPNFSLLKTLGVRGIIVTARADATDEFDFVSRFFAPGSGIDEDPVTGSAHCCLGPFWQKRLGKSEFVARQISARGGTVRVRVANDRVHLGGQAVTILRGELLF
jgi:PhzF family phenazine biosynthesis protein